MSVSAPCSLARVWYILHLRASIHLWYRDDQQSPVSHLVPLYDLDTISIASLVWSVRIQTSKGLLHCHDLSIKRGPDRLIIVLPMYCYLKEVVDSYLQRRFTFRCSDVPVPLCDFDVISVTWSGADVLVFTEHIRSLSCVWSSMFWTGVLVMLDHCVMPAFVCMTLPALACFLASSVSGTETRFGGAYYRPCFSTGMDFYRILGIAPFGPNPSCFGSRP